MPWLGEYLEQPGCAYFIRAGGKLAGFALVDQDVLDPSAMQAVSEFFVLRDPKPMPFTPLRGQLGFFDAPEELQP